MNKTLFTSLALGSLTISAAAWAASTQIQNVDIVFHASGHLREYHASIDKGANSYFAGGNTGDNKPVVQQLNTGHGGYSKWITEIDGVSGAFEDIIMIGSTVCAAGTADDDNDDGGDNVIVACFNSANGDLLWHKEFENVTDNMTDLEFERLSGGKGLMVWVRDTDAQNRMVLGLNTKTGAPIQNP